MTHADLAFIPQTESSALWGKIGQLSKHKHCEVFKVKQNKSEKWEEQKKKKKKKKNANHDHSKPAVERFWTNLENIFH